MAFSSRALCLLFALSLATAACAACSSASDCSLAGECKQNACVCDKGWSGPSCNMLSNATIPVHG